MNIFEKSINFIFLVELFIGVLGVIPCTEENGFYECEGGRCIPLTWLCDSANDCPEGDDEYHFSCGSREDRGECEPFHFQCTDPRSNQSKCVRNEWKCDGYIDCQDAIDEENCEARFTKLQPLFGQPTPPPSKPNGTSSENWDSPDSFRDGEFPPIFGVQNLTNNSTVIRNSNVSNINMNELVKNFTLIVNKAEERSKNRSNVNVAGIKPVQPITLGGLGSTTKKLNITLTTTTTVRPVATVSNNSTTSNTSKVNSTVTTTTTARPVTTFPNNSTVSNMSRLNPFVPVEEGKLVSPNFTLHSVDSDPGTNFTVKPFIRPKNESREKGPVLVTVKGVSSTTLRPFIRPENQDPQSVVNSTSTKRNSTNSSTTKSSSTTSTTPLVKTTLKTLAISNSTAASSTRPTITLLTRSSITPSTTSSTPSLVHHPNNPINFYVYFPPNTVKSLQPESKTTAASRPNPSTVPAVKAGVFFSSDTKSDTPIRIQDDSPVDAVRPAVGTPIVPREDFQVLIPMDVIREQEAQQSEVSKLQEKEVVHSTVYPDFKFANDDETILRARRPASI